MVNCYPLNQQCDSCYNTIQQFINNYNPSLINSFSFTTNVGAKLLNPFHSKQIIKSATGGISGSYCTTRDNNNFNQMAGTGEGFKYYWYNVNTIPFISSSQSPTGWVNLPSLGAVIPCNTGSYSVKFSSQPFGLGYFGKTSGFSIRFPHLTNTGFDYSLSTNDFEIYAEAGFGITGSNNATQNVSPPPCPDPSSSLIYSYSASVATVYTSSHFWQGNNPILIIDP
jgi:hypothetical protein